MEQLLKSRYKVGEKLSENPFSVTYKGAFLGSEKPVIIKIYKRGTLNSSLISRMKQKVKDLSHITYHGIAKLIDGDYGWQGFYYVREYIQGKTLQEILEGKEKLGAEKAAVIAEEICRALEFAHGRGIIHGALKPSNVFIDEQGLVKIADFVVEGEIKESIPQKILTIMSDGRYLPPEELLGLPSTTAADIYAMGLILFELFAGKLALPGEGLEGSLQKLKKREILERSQLAALPRYLAEIITKSLQADPRLRFPGINYLRQSLENKTIILPAPAFDEYVQIFDSTVTQYGEETRPVDQEMLEDIGRIRIKWSKEKHRNWILAGGILAAALMGILYAFLFGR